MKNFLSVIFLIILFCANSSYSQYSSPESVTYDTAGMRYLVSNTASQKIVQRDRQGVVTDFVTVGSSIHGVTVYNNVVYVCNGTRVRGYNLNSAQEVFNVTVTGSTFLNDLSIDNSGVMYVSDFSARRIYKIIIATSSFWIYVANTTTSPNGVYVDAPRNRLLFCCWGSNAAIKAVNFSDSSVATLVTTTYSNLDGISLDRNDNVYVSSWGIQSVVKYDINFSNAPTVVIGSLSNPADIYVNKLTDTLAIPNAGNNTVVFQFLNNPSGINSNEPEHLTTFELNQNYPNPFNPKTVISYSLSVNSLITLKVYDLLGNETETLVNEKKAAGNYKIQFDGTNYSSGVYFYSIYLNGEFKDSRRMLLLK